VLEATPIEVWLDWQQSQPAIVVPYARAPFDATVAYRVTLTRTGSRVVQRGQVRLESGVAAPISRIAVSRTPQDACSVEVSLEPEGGPALLRAFDCPP
jgi:hypothetical protein